MKSDGDASHTQAGSAASPETLRLRRFLWSEIVVGSRGEEFLWIFTFK